jgi:hypothetical protein
MKKSIVILLILVTSFLSINGFAQNAMALSQDMLMSLKMNTPSEDSETQLANLSFEALQNELNTDLKKQAFWVNVYITYSQKALLENSECDNSCRNKKFIQVANRVFSLNDILYRILLHSKCKVFGNQKLFAPKWEKQLRVSYPDGRVLLAIDANEKITNAVTYYEPELINKQLNEVSSIFIDTFIHYDIAKNEVTIPKWISRFKREFGGKSGIIAGLKKAGLINQGVENTTILFSKKIATLK